MQAANRACRYSQLLLPDALPRAAFTPLRSLVVALDYRNPHMNLYQEFQQFKRLPMVARLLEGGNCLQVGAWGGGQAWRLSCGWLGGSRVVPRQSAAPPTCSCLHCI